MSSASMELVFRPSPYDPRGKGWADRYVRRNRVRRLQALLAVAAAAAAVAGCGGSSSSSTPLSPTAWKQKVNSICADVTQKSRAVPKPSTPSELPGFLKKLEGYGNDEIAQIKALNPPSQYSNAQKAIVSDLGTIWGKLGSLINQGLTGTKLIAAAQQFGTQIQTPAKDYLTQTRAAGLTSCILTTAGG
jgi:hypothetical protein